MPPFCRPYLSHLLVMVASGGVAFRVHPCLCCRCESFYTACRNPSYGIGLTVTPLGMAWDALW